MLLDQLLILSLTALGLWLVIFPALLQQTLNRWLLVEGDFRRIVCWARGAAPWLPFLHRNLVDLERCALAHLGLMRSASRVPAIELRGDYRYFWVNSEVNFLITAGRYEAAMRVGEIPGFVPITRRLDTIKALVCVNVAEALYNLGKWDEAWQRLEALDGRCDALALAGLLNQRCWILAHTERSAEGLTLHDTIERDALPPIYRAEHHFTRAALLLGLARYDEAAVEARLGETLASRASSKRNATFLLGRIALAKGELEAAEKLFRAASRHRYRCQGGDGLLAWGDCLSRLGRPVEALAAWQLCIERDPESVWAAAARARS